MRYDLLVTRNANGDLEVPDLEIDRGDSATIVWTLDSDSLPLARFTKSPASLTWSKDPPWNVIKGFQIISLGRQMWIEDKHIGSGTADRFPYLLKVLESSPDFGTRYYSSGLADAKGGRAITSPVIINR
jgi:hypothetical protein